MNFIKKLIPNKIKQEGKYFLYDLLKQPYNRYDVPLDIVKWLPNNNEISFIDIGASRGDFSNSLNKFYKVKQAILIEPIPALAYKLKEKFSGNTNFEILNMAVADKVGEAEFYFSQELDVLSSLLKIKSEFHRPFLISSAGEKTIVKTNTLDNIVQERDLQSIDLIKIDVQGAEHLVLESGINALKLTKLVHTEFSYRPMYDGSSTFFDIYKILNDNNFRFAGSTPVCNVNGEIVQGDGLFVNNILCS